MSKSALLLLLLTLFCACLLWLLPNHNDWLLAALKITLPLSSLGLVIALLLGKRIKFDPVLR